MKIAKTFIPFALLFGLSQMSYANTAVEIACSAQTTAISDEDFKTLVSYGEKLVNEEEKLQLPSNCQTTMEIDGKKLPNPFVIALEHAAKQNDTAVFGLLLNEHLPQNVDMAQKAEAHSELLKYIKIACADQLFCVTQLIREIPALTIKESPIFCAFARVADYTVQDFYQKTQPTPKYPVACLGHSTLTESMGLSPMQDWFAAYKLLGK